MAELRLNRLKSTLALTALAFLGASFARADMTLPPGPVTVLDHSELVGGSFSNALDFMAPAAGTITVALTDLVWPTTLGSLKFAITDGQTILDSSDSPNPFNVSSAGHYFAIVYGQAQNAFNMGLYDLKVTWSSVVTPSSVPLPAAAWLLVSGAAGLLGFARRRKEVSMV